MSGGPDQDPHQQADADDSHREAQDAADGLKNQIAALRARVQDAHQTLSEHERRRREQRTFRR